MKTLLIQSSLFGEGGVSSRLAHEFLRGEKAVVRDLSTNPVPHLDAARFGAFLAKPAERTPEQQAIVAYSDSLISELREAETIVFALPMYNFGIPSQLKAYFDHIARAGETFRYTDKGPVGLLAGRKAYVFAARGGIYGENHHSEAYVREMLGFVGIDNVQFTYAEGLALKKPEALAA